MSNCSDIEEFRGNTPATFSDPLTGYAPYSEREYVHTLVMLHLQRRIKWDLVDLLKVGVANVADGKPSNVIGVDDWVVSEPALLSYKKDLSGPDVYAENRWGDMGMDLLFVQGRKDAFSQLTFIEAKLDSGFTHGSSPQNSQIARYIDYLMKVRKHWLEVKCTKEFKINLLLLCPSFNRDWYSERFANCIRANEASQYVNCYIALWDGIKSPGTESFLVRGVFDSYLV